MDNYFLENAIEHSKDIESIPIHKCGPSDDPDMQYAYSAAFRDSVSKFIFYAKKIQEPILQELLIGIDDEIDSGFIGECHAIRSKLRVAADYLKQLQADPNFKESILKNDSFVENDLIKKLKEIRSSRFDLRKLVKMVEELNYAYQSENYLSSTLLLRAIINHVPPIFSATNFAQVVANSNRSVKAILSILEDGARPIADLHTHMMIRKKESIPSRNQIEPYKAPFELLINEILYELDNDNNK
jgi:hypothetical protein